MFSKADVLLSTFHSHRFFFSLKSFLSSDVEQELGGGRYPSTMSAMTHPPNKGRSHSHLREGRSGRQKG